MVEKIGRKCRIFAPDRKKNVINFKTIVNFGIINCWTIIERAQLLLKFFTK